MQTLQTITVENLCELPVSALQSWIDRADIAYYRSGHQAIMADSLYDLIKKRLLQLSPEDERHHRVGSPYSAEEMRTKITHSIPMGSLDNTDDGVKGYAKWHDMILEAVQGSSLRILHSLKIDGSSICASYRNGKLVRAVTRGNGTVGDDVTANAAQFQGLPTVLPELIDCEVRGEAILFKADFETICQRDNLTGDDISNARNVGNGIVGRSDGKDAHMMHFLAFNIVTPGLTRLNGEDEKLAFLSRLGFNVVPHAVVNSIQEIHDFHDHIVDIRDTLPYDIDGIVVVLNSLARQQEFITSDIKSQLRPKYARAIKLPLKSAITEIIDVVVTVGHTGAIIPTAGLKRVRVGGVFVSSALMNNWNEVRDMDVAVGDKVKVVLSGDIIPKIVGVVDRPKNRIPIQEPTTCPACRSATTRNIRGKDGAVTYCTNNRCPDVVYAKIDKWVGTSKKGVGIMDLGDEIITALFEAGHVSDPADLYTITVETLENLTTSKGVRVGRSRAEKIVKNITSKKTLPLPVFLGSLGIELLGRRRAEMMITQAEGKLNTLDDWLNEAVWENLAMPGLGLAIREAIVKGLEDCKPLINKLRSVGVHIGDVVTVAPDPEKSVATIAGKSFCFTGTRDLVEEVQAAGGIIKSGVSKGLHYLVQKDPTSTSGKTMKAESYGTKIIGVDYLREVLAGNAILDDV